MNISFTISAISLVFLKIAHSIKLQIIQKIVLRNIFVINKLIFISIHALDLIPDMQMNT